MPKQDQLLNWVNQLGNHRLGLVFFGTRWSGTSDMMRSIVGSLVSENATELALLSFDLDEHPEYALEYQVCELPTLLFFQDGSILTRSQGLVPRHELASQIASLLNANKDHSISNQQDFKQ